MKTETLKLVTCKTCKTENLVNKNEDVISDSDIDQIENIETLVCLNCGTIYDIEGQWFQKNLNVKTMGYNKTSELNGNIKDWNKN